MYKRLAREAKACVVLSLYIHCTQYHRHCKTALPDGQTKHRGCMHTIDPISSGSQTSEGASRKAMCWTPSRLGSITVRTCRRGAFLLPLPGAADALTTVIFEVMCHLV